MVIFFWDAATLLIDFVPGSSILKAIDPATVTAMIWTRNFLHINLQSWITWFKHFGGMSDMPRPLLTWTSTFWILLSNNNRLPPVMIPWQHLFIQELQHYSGRCPPPDAHVKTVQKMPIQPAWVMVELSRRTPSPTPKQNQCSAYSQEASSKMYFLRQQHFDIRQRSTE